MNNCRSAGGRGGQIEKLASGEWRIFLGCRRRVQAGDWRQSLNIGTLVYTQFTKILQIILKLLA